MVSSRSRKYSMIIILQGQAQRLVNANVLKFELQYLGQLQGYICVQITAIITMMAPRPYL